MWCTGLVSAGLSPAVRRDDTGMDGCDAQSQTVDETLQRLYPDARCELQARDPWELLVAAILSARSSDIQVNKIMAVLNEHYVGPHAYARLDHRDLERVIRHVPLFRQKARAIVEAARALVRYHGGLVPEHLVDLAELPGVGRKTAAVVQGNAFGIPAIAADVHVQRIVHRLGWTSVAHPGKAETALSQRYPPQRWVRLCHQLIRLGRDCCRRQKPKCGRCPLAHVCARQGVVDGEGVPMVPRPTSP
jgi:endonuclease-3